ncbi:hypothetical protein E2C01_093692 [Portunus trituberculatus]|uniref:Uncharacterized protein n=1 Tax=Portunus trituberculatus TaxID=210409 RepID=A0A5B7JVI2_PORTR|nr:hypothetical protein [Portunus trituberculatus]
MRYAGVHLRSSSLAGQLEASRGRCGPDLWDRTCGRVRVGRKRKRERTLHSLMSALCTATA